MGMINGMIIGSVALSPLLATLLLRPKIEPKYLTLTDCNIPRMQEDYNLFADFIDAVRARFSSRRCTEKNMQSSSAVNQYHEDLAEVGLKPTEFNLDTYKAPDLTFDPNCISDGKHVLDNGQYLFEGESVDDLTVDRIKADRISVSINGASHILPVGKIVEVFGEKYNLSVSNESDEHGNVRQAAVFWYVEG